MTVDAQPTLNADVLANLRQLATQADPDLVKTIVAIFARDSPLITLAIRHAVLTSGSVEVAAGLHQLKGSSANVGAQRVAALCRSLECSTEAGEQPPSVVLDQLDDEIERAVRELLLEV